MHLLDMQNLTSHVNLAKSSSFTFTTISCIHYEQAVNTLAEIFAYGYVQKFDILIKKFFFFYLRTSATFSFRIGHITNYPSWLTNQASNNQSIYGGGVI